MNQNPSPPPAGYQPPQPPIPPPTPSPYQAPAQVDWQGTRVEPYTPLKGLATATVALLGVGIAVDILSSILNLAMGSSMAQIDQPNPPGEAIVAAFLVGGSAILQLFVYIATVVVFLMWIFRAYRNLPALGARELTFTPGWAVGWWFVPLANLVRPFEVTKEIWKASDPDNRDETGLKWKDLPIPSLLGVWWAFWIIQNIAAQASFRLSMNAKTPDQVLLGSRLDVLANVLSMVAAVLLIMVVRRITAREEERYARMGSGAIPATGPHFGYQQPAQQAYPQHSYPQSGYPQQSYPQQPYPQQSYPPQAYPPQSAPQQTYPQTTYPQAGQPQPGNVQANPPQQVAPQPPYQQPTYQQQGGQQPSQPQSHLTQPLPSQDPVTPAFQQFASPQISPTHYHPPAAAPPATPIPTPPMQAPPPVQTPASPSPPPTQPPDSGAAPESDLPSRS